ncbi:MAG: hypothetical protein CMB47_02295 [Euryarchaeota archaeon]|nr:hypothetical protein [Euryarchaeota archaeon]
MYSFPSSLGENSERSVEMNLGFCSSGISSVNIQGERIESTRTEISKSGINESVLGLIANIILTHCSFVKSSVERHILTSMEHCSYIISNINLKKLFPCLVILILIPSNSLATSECNDSEMDFNIIKTIDHQPNSFTQGLEIKDTRLFESTGIYGSSSLRELNISSGEVIREINFDEDIFSEGISILNDSIVMLTWREEHAKIFDIDTFELIGNYNYTGEGWGLCNNGDNFIMSNGSSKLAIRNINDFNISSLITVKENNKEISNLNELECVGDLVYANIWKENRIISINITSGIVQNSFSLESLSHNQKDADSVLNGIAFSEQDNYFLLTGKNWEKIYSIDLTSFNESNMSCNDIESDISKFNQIANYLSKNVFLSIISLVAITIFVMPGSWPALTFLFFRTFMRQHEQLNTSGITTEEEEN